MSGPLQIHTRGTRDRENSASAEKLQRARSALGCRTCRRLCPGGSSPWSGSSDDGPARVERPSFERAAGRVRPPTWPRRGTYSDAEFVASLARSDSGRQVIGGRSGHRLCLHAARVSGRRAVVSIRLRTRDRGACSGRVVRRSFRGRWFLVPRDDSWGPSTCGCVRPGEAASTCPSLIVRRRHHHGRHRRRRRSTARATTHVFRPARMWTAQEAQETARGTSTVRCTSTAATRTDSTAMAMAAAVSELE